MEKLDFYYGNEAEQFSFLRIPKALFSDAEFSKISTDAKLLYGLMLDRMSLSMKNGWLDESGRVYIYFTLEDAMEYLNVCRRKAIKLFAELDSQVGCGLIHRKRQGCGKPALIYVKNFSSGAEKTTSTGAENDTSVGAENELQEVQKIDSNNTNINNNNINNTEMNNILSEEQISDEIRERDLYLQKIRRNIGYDVLVMNYDKAMIDGIVKLMLDSVCSKKKMLTVGCERIQQRYVRCRLLELDYSHIEYVIECITNLQTKIHNIKSYMLTTLFNAPTTMDAYYTAQVQRDLARFNNVA